MELPACLSTCECKPYVRQLEHTIHSLRKQLNAQQRLLDTRRVQDRAPRQRAEPQSQITRDTLVPAVQPERVCTPRTPPRTPSCSPVRQRKRRRHEHRLDQVPGLVEFQLSTHLHPRIYTLMALEPWSVQGQSCVNALRASLVSGTGLTELVEQSRSSGDSASHDSELLALTQFAHLTVQRTVNAQTELAYGRFQQFLLVLACAVLDAQGTSLEALSSISTIGLGEIYTDAWCKVLMSTALWMSKLVNALDDDGWNMRASELLLAWNQKVYFFRPLAQSPDDSINVLVNELRPHKEDFLRTPLYMALSIPSLLKMLVPHLELVTICKTIGMNVDHLGTAPWAQSRSQ